MKEMVIARFQTNRKRSLEFLSSLPESAWETYTLGTWHLREVVAHLIGWSYESAQALAELAKGQPPSYDEYNKEDDWAEINRIFIAKYAEGTPEDMVRMLRGAGEHMVFEAGKLSPQAFEESNGVFRKNRQWTVSVELDDTTDHEKDHIDRIMAALAN